MFRLENHCESLAQFFLPVQLWSFFVHFSLVQTSCFLDYPDSLVLKNSQSVSISEKVWIR